MSSNKELTHTTRALNELGFQGLKKVTNTLDGSIWKSSQQMVKRNNNVVIIKSNKVIKISTIYKNNSDQINNNALEEIAIFKYLTENNMAPKSIVKYYGHCNSFACFISIYTIYTIII